MNTLSDRDNFTDINLLGIWRTLTERWKLISLSTLITAIVAAGASYLIRPVYRADVLLAGASRDATQTRIQDLLGQYSGLASLAGLDTTGTQRQSVDETIEILRSRSFTEQFITKLNLMPILFAEQSVADASSESPEGVPTMWDAYELFDGIRTISRDTRTGFFKVGIEWHDPAVASSWANSLVNMLNEHLRSRAIDEATRSIAYLQEQLDQTAVVERRQMLIGLMEGETRRIVLAKARDEYAARVLDRAVAPEDKVRPRRAMIAISGALVGLIIGIVGALWLEWLRGSRPR